jgi:hypothetical protein
VWQHHPAAARREVLFVQPVQKQNRAECLALRRRADLLFHGEPRQEPFDLLGAHCRRMCLAVEQDESPDPLDVGLFRAPAVVP